VSSRPYRSPLREERALETRRRIRTSAWDLFAQRGFSGTTIGQIAADAGVSPQTVYAVFGSKGGIVSAMLEQLEQEAGLAEHIVQIAAEDEPARQLRLFVSSNRRLFEVGAPLLRAFMAARHDPDVAAVGARGDRGRLEGATHLTRGFASAGALRPGLEPDDAAERLWLLTSLEQYLLATDQLGWSPDRYEQWLGDLLEAELLTSPLR
jgi:AcrR family transcriptional regulator